MVQPREALRLHPAWRKVTGRRMLRRLKQKRSHLRRKKSKRVLRSLSKDQPVAKADRKRVRRLLGGLQ